MRVVTSLIAAALLATASLAPVAAHVGSAPCETGSQYALTHVVHFAQGGLLGQTHKPGEHQGFANVPDVCE